MTRIRTRTLARAGALATLVLTMLALATSIATAAVTMHGTFATPTTQGAISFSPARAFHGAVEGTFTVAGKKYPGSEYAAVGGGTGLVWYYGTSGITAGNALVTLQPDGTYSGPIWFFARSGATTDSGTVIVTFP